jgi:hypothetical protein
MAYVLSPFTKPTVVKRSAEETRIVVTKSEAHRGGIGLSDAGGNGLGLNCCDGIVDRSWSFGPAATVKLLQWVKQRTAPSA